MKDRDTIQGAREGVTERKTQRPRFPRGSWDRSLCNFPHMSALICPHLPPAPTPRHHSTTTATTTIAAVAAAANYPKLLRWYLRSPKHLLLTPIAPSSLPSRTKVIPTTSIHPLLFFLTCPNLTHPRLNARMSRALQILPSTVADMVQLSFYEFDRDLGDRYAFMDARSFQNTFSTRILRV